MKYSLMTLLACCTLALAMDNLNIPSIEKTRAALEQLRAESAKLDPISMLALADFGECARNGEYVITDPESKKKLDSLNLLDEEKNRVSTFHCANTIHLRLPE
jgi:hypothetical protein